MIELRNFSFMRKQADGSVFQLAPLNLQLEQGSHWALVGENGAGKTSLALALIGGLRLIKGEVLVAGKILKSAPQERQAIGAVFREPLLFSHLSVLENLAFSQKVLLKEELLPFINALGLTDILESPIPQLSSGQQQRVALGRALIAKPSLLILDEPYDAISAPERAPLAESVRRLARAAQITLLQITHDPLEVLHYAERVMIMPSPLKNSGVNVKYGSVKELRNFPNSLLTARLLMVPSLFTEVPAKSFSPSFLELDQRKAGGIAEGYIKGVLPAQASNSEAEWAPLVGPSSSGEGVLFASKGGLIEVKVDHLPAQGAGRYSARAQVPGLFLDFSDAHLSAAKIVKNRA